MANRQRSCMGRLLSCAVFLILAGLVTGLSMHFLLDRNDIPERLRIPEKYADKIGEINIIEDIDGLLNLFRGEDPFAETNQGDPNEANRWNNNGFGLELVYVSPPVCWP